MNENLNVYNSVREVPKEAQKTIQGGRLKGFTDINPMWRVKSLTEQFGMVGVGWYYEITNKEIIKATEEESIAIVDINLYVKTKDGEWSKPIQGTGGSSFITKEKYGLYISDECFKMALTDALSVSCKQLGMGADIYWMKDRSKYDVHQENSTRKTNTTPTTPATQTKTNINQAKVENKNKGVTKQEGNIRELIGKINEKAKLIARGSNKDKMVEILNEIHGSTNYTTLTDPAKAQKILDELENLK